MLILYGTNPIHESKDLMVLSPPQGPTILIVLYWGLTSNGNFEETKDIETITVSSQS
jgi:hypothetical protein